MPETVTPPPAPPTSQIPSLLESLAGQMDISNAPVIKGKELPPMIKDDDKKEDKPKVEEPPKT